MESSNENESGQDVFINALTNTDVCMCVGPAVIGGPAEKTERCSW